MTWGKFAGFAGRTLFFARTHWYYAVSYVSSGRCKFSSETAGVNIITLYDMGANKSFMSYACCVELKDLAILKVVPAMSVHSSTGHDLSL